MAWGEALMVQQLWFGTKQKFQWMPMPSSGIQRRNVFNSEFGTLDRGGAYVSRSRGHHTEIDFSFGVREASGLGGLNGYLAYANGMWSDYVSVVDGFNPNDLIYFTDPMSMRENLFSPSWATPMLSLSGDFPHLGPLVSNAATAANVYNQPARTPTFAITHAANSLPSATSQKFVIPIPPGQTVRLGWSGSVTGTGYMRAEAHVIATGALTPFTVAPQTATSLTRGTTGFSGDVYDYVVVGLARSSSASSTVSVTSMMAQCFPSGYTTTMTGPHIPGVGQTGCQFQEDIIEEYVQAEEAIGGRRLKGLSFGLVETGAWLP